MYNKEEIEKQIHELEDGLEPLREQQREIWRKEHEEVEAKLDRVYRGKDKFLLDELVFAAYNRCPCGAGMAYPNKTSPHGSWDCSDILLGRSIPKGQEGSKTHTGTLPFTFYEIKSENQPSAHGATTRPKE